MVLVVVLVVGLDSPGPPCAKPSPGHPSPPPGPLSRTAQYFALFVALFRPQFRSFPVSLGVFSSNFGAVFEGRDPANLEFLGCPRQRKLWWARGKKREISGPHSSPPSLPTLRGPTVRGPEFPCFFSSWKTPFLAKIGQLRLAKVGLAKVGISRLLHAPLLCGTTVSHLAHTMHQNPHHPSTVRDNSASNAVSGSATS